MVCLHARSLLLVPISASRPLARQVGGASLLAITSIVCPRTRVPTATLRPPPSLRPCFAPATGGWLRPSPPHGSQVAPQPDKAACPLQPTPASPSQPSWSTRLAHSADARCAGALAWRRPGARRRHPSCAGRRQRRDRGARRAARSVGVAAGPTEHTPHVQTPSRLGSHVIIVANCEDGDGGQGRVCKMRAGHVTFLSKLRVGRTLSATCASYFILWPAGPMARRLTTNQEIVGSSPTLVITFCCCALWRRVTCSFLLRVRAGEVCVAGWLGRGASGAAGAPAQVLGAAHHDRARGALAARLAAHVRLRELLHADNGRQHVRARGGGSRSCTTAGQAICGQRRWRRYCRWRQGLEGRNQAMGAPKTGFFMTCRLQ